MKEGKEAWFSFRDGNGPGDADFPVDGDNGEEAGVCTSESSSVYLLYQQTWSQISSQRIYRSAKDAMHAWVHTP